MVPAGACDCHVHVFGPASRFPYAEERVYTPDDAPLADLVRHLAAINIDRVVIVQPSPYGSDNHCTVDGLHQLGKSARGVAVVADDTGHAALQELHRAGIRGIRLNLETAGIRDPEVARRRLVRDAERVAPLGWHIQTYTNLAVIAAVHDTIENLPVPLVVDHFGRPDASKGLDQPGLPVLIDLVGSGKVYVKLSAPYRISKQESYADADAIARALVAANPNRVLWGSDWPHPFSPTNQPRSRDKVEEFFREDDGRALSRAAHWVPDPTERQKFLVDNAKRLYDF